jgi:predicted transport protein
LSQEILDSYTPKIETKTEYTIDDHPYLAKGSEMYGDDVRNLFEAFRKEVLALDPCVTETFLKFYVAYKAETNFVDVVPQAKRLRLSLNIKFSDIDDPKKFGRDISKLGRWGNGDVEVGLSKIEELPYVMGLVRQSFEKQMGQDIDL